MMCSMVMLGQTSYTISDPEDIETLTLVAGDEVVLTNGTYTTDERINFIANGTIDNPITFRAETPGGVIFTGGLSMNIGGDYLVVEGFYWKGGIGQNNHIQFRHNTTYSNHSTIQNCTIDGLLEDGDSKHRWIVLYGTYNNVVNCSFLNKTSPGALVLAELLYNFELGDSVVGHQIRNNYFYNFEKVDTARQNAGDSETIRVGASSYQAVNANVTVEGNYFNKADGENEIITNKSANNIYKNNTFRACRGSLVLRHGAAATINANYFLGENVEGTGGIRISDSDHIITNNYIQDVINVDSQAQWNNGITFIGGSVASGGTSNGYQIVEDIVVAHNSFYNVNAPLYFNDSKGSTDPTGVFANNLIYTTLTDVISGSFDNMGGGLSYQGNIYEGSNLGESLSTSEFIAGTIGFGLVTDGEVYQPSATGAAANAGVAMSHTVTNDVEGLTRPSTGLDVGANEVSGGTGVTLYTPYTNAMVGDAVGSCFVGAQGVLLSTTTCTIATVETLSVGNISDFTYEGGSQDVILTTNVEWVATVSDPSWMSVDMSSGTTSATISVTVTEHTDSTDRNGNITFTKVGGTLSRVLNISQTAPDFSDLYTLINTGDTGDPVTIHSFSKEQVDGSSKFNYAANTIDKDEDTDWAADDGDVVSGDYKGDGEYIIYDLGDNYSLDLIQFSTTDKSDSFGYQIWVSTTGTNAADFTKALPVSEDLLLTATNSTDFNQYTLATSARYVKVIGYGRFNTAGDTRESVWSAISEIEFYGTLESLSIRKVSAAVLGIQLFPNPIVDNILYIEKKEEGVESVSVYSISGSLAITQKLDSNTGTEQVNVSSLRNGVYFVQIAKENSISVSKVIIAK